MTGREKVFGRIERCLDELQGEGAVLIRIGFVVSAIYPGEEPVRTAMEEGVAKWTKDGVDPTPVQDSASHLVLAEGMRSLADTVTQLVDVPMRVGLDDGEEEERNDG